MNLRDWARKQEERFPIFGKYLIGNCTFAEAAMEALEGTKEPVEPDDPPVSEEDLEKARLRYEAGEDPEIILKELLDPA